MNKAKTKQLEQALSRVGALAAQAAEDTEATHKRLLKLQAEIEQLYISLEEPLAVAKAREKHGRC